LGRGGEERSNNETKKKLAARLKRVATGVYLQGGPRHCDNGTPEGQTRRYRRNRPEEKKEGTSQKKKILGAREHFSKRVVGQRIRCPRKGPRSEKRFDEGRPLLRWVGKKSPGKKKRDGKWSTRKTEQGDE